MPFRVTETATNARLAAQITTATQRLSKAQEQLATGKSINRPSDDPTGAEVVLRLRTSQTVVEQFQRNAGAAKDQLLRADGALNIYQQTLDRARTLLTQGASDSTDAAAKRTIAAEIDGLRQQMLALANSRHDEQYVFGGTRQNAPPYNAAGVPAASATTAQLIQVDPNGPPIITGVTAEATFSDATGSVFDALAAAATALRGTGVPATDQATVLTQIDRLTTFTDLALVSRTTVGVSLTRVDAAIERLDQDALSLETAAQNIEVTDFAAAAVKLSEAGRALDAIIQSASQVNRRSLIDFLG